TTTPTVMAILLRTLCQGIKVGVEIILMATDGGCIAAGEKVIAITGTGRGSDTAVVAIAATSTKLHELHITSERIYIIGFCSGAASACIFASQNSVGALVLDGCFADVRDMVADQAVLMGIPRFLVNFLTPGLLLMTEIIYDYELVNAQDVIADVACPIFFIYEENDELISLEEMQLLFDLATHPANQFWEVGDAEHSQSYKTHPAEYIERVDGFLSALD
ncbi:unnamed protein product, partial [marine sediment metagenome]